jgi:hypothetical protein
MSDLIEQDPFNRRVHLLLPVVHQRSGQSRMSLNGQVRPFTPKKDIGNDPVSKHNRRCSSSQPQ